MLGWFSLWSFSTSVLIAFVVASHFSRRESFFGSIFVSALGIIHLRGDFGSLQRFADARLVFPMVVFDIGFDSFRSRFTL
jgi:hypothetical protein